MILKNIKLINFRNYITQEINFNENINIFLGKNAQGKTNLLEAVYYLATGRTFRNNKDFDLVNWDQNFFRLTCTLFKKNTNRDYQLEIYYDQSKNKQIKINGVKYPKISDLFGYLQVIIFSPDDLSIIKGSPIERRRYIDFEISQLINGYYQTLINYNKVLQQRNNLLKEIKNNMQKPEFIEVWDEQLIKYGSIIIKNRIDFLKNIIPLARKTQEEITSGTEKIEIKYKSTIINKPISNIKEISEHFRNIIIKNKKQEIFKAQSLYGPHRDDLLFYINEKELKIFGSQGQQRTAILALKLAELKLYFYKNEDYPLLLLDDVMSELDDYRRDFLLKIIKDNNIQTLITGANLELIKKETHRLTLFNVEKGIIKRENKKEV